MIDVVSIMAISIAPMVIMSVVIILLIAGVLARLVQLDVAALQRARDAVAIREAKREGVLSAGLPVVAHVDAVGESGATVHFRGPLDPPGLLIERGVPRDARPLHLRPVAEMVLIGEVAPELPVLLSPPTHTQNQYPSPPLS